MDKTDCGVFRKFENGMMILEGTVKEAAVLPWNKHAKFERVELKHLITAENTAGKFSYHLVRIAPGKNRRAYA